MTSLARISVPVSSDVVGYPKNRNPREKPDFFDTQTQGTTDTVLVSVSADISVLVDISV